MSSYKHIAQGMYEVRWYLQKLQWNPFEIHGYSNFPTSLALAPGERLFINGVQLSEYPLYICICVCTLYVFWIHNIKCYLTTFSVHTNTHTYVYIHTWVYWMIIQSTNTNANEIKWNLKQTHTHTDTHPQLEHLQVHTSIHVCTSVCAFISISIYLCMFVTELMFCVHRIRDIPEFNIATVSLVSISYCIDSNGIGITWCWSRWWHHTHTQTHTQ